LEHTVIAHPLDAVAGPTALMILGGSALYVAGHALFKVRVFEHRPWSRVAAIVVLVAASIIGPALPALVVGLVAAIVMFAVALSDRVVYRQAS
jgi:low temperature requirement protein LtrA